MKSYKVAGPSMSAAQLQAVLLLRAEVFVVEQNTPYQDVDGRDLEAGTVHYWLGDSKPASYLRLLTEPGEVRIGRVCTDIKARGAGLANQLMLDVLADIGDVPSVLDAQTYVQGFYAKFGYVAEGEEYLDVDGIPHITMRRRAGND